MTSLDRRTFLKGLGAAGFTLATPNFVARAAESVAALAAKAPPAYSGWMDIYREQWTWDKVVRGTHLLNCWYQAHCSWDVYVKDGLVFREEQAAEYKQINAKLPDYNPRGCQKGACFSERMYDPTRVRYPLRRVGPRGGGKWERVSWDEALNDIADKYLDVTLAEGTDRTILDLGPGIDVGVATAGQLRFSNLTRAICLDMNAEIGDSHRGALETFGKIAFDRSADDFMYSDLILVWGCNPVYTSIPNAHFLTEARYNGAKIIVIAPDYNASATKADMWVPVKPGTDAALALAVARILIDKNKVNHDFLREQTDMPLLVRGDNGSFLTEADVVAGGSPERHMVFDGGTGKLAVMPSTTLKLDGIRPKVDVKATEVPLQAGGSVAVRSVYSLLRDRLDEYTPEYASKICGTNPKLIHRLADEIAKSKAMSNHTMTSLCKYYHGNLIERSIILLFTLKGQYGEKGAGYSGWPLIVLDGVDLFGAVPHIKDVEQFAAGMMQQFAARRAAGYTDESTIYEMYRAPYVSTKGLPPMTSGSLFWSVHGGLTDMPVAVDPFNKVPTKQRLAEALEKKWQFLTPAPGRDPRIIFHCTSNPLRRLRGSQKVRETLWPKLKLSVALDWRMSSTGHYADYVLPVAAWYERTAHKWVAALSPYLTVTNEAVKPVGESKTEWTVWVLLAKAIQRRAKERGLTTITGAFGEDVHLDRVYDDFTMGGLYAEEMDDAVAKTIFDLSSNAKGIEWEPLKEKGFTRFTAVGNTPMTVGGMCDIPPDDSITPFTYHRRDKVPYPTETRRIQTYLNHSLYKEMDETLPRHKDAPATGGDYPLITSGGHTRWSIHSAWRDSETMLRLHRGEPFILISPKDAADRKIEDHDWVEVFNDIGSFIVRAKTTPAVQPGQTLVYHAWENYQFPGKGDMNHVSPSPINPVELAGGHPHLRSGYFMGQASYFDRDTRIDVRKVSAEHVRELARGEAV